ncbi:MAG: Fe-S-containing hydro-lyase [Oscillospiraceae bacterium]|nr:Fe-S-containing hydro-lyase [Oscillospiraceae bacterium]
MKQITTPLSNKVIRDLKAGEQIILSGTIYTGRDAAHKRIAELLDRGNPLPFDFQGQAIYYAGPCPAPPGKIIGSAGPTTSSRMDEYTPRLIQKGLRVMIGKGLRNSAVIDAIRQYTGVYLTAVGGAGAFYSKCVESSEIVAFDELGAEAVFKLTVRDMPLVVSIDCKGDSIYELRERIVEETL